MFFFEGLIEYCSKNIQPYDFSYLIFFRDRVSLCITGRPGSHSVDQAGLEFRNPSAFASQVLGLKDCTSTARPGLGFLSGSLVMTSTSLGVIGLFILFT